MCSISAVSFGSGTSTKSHFAVPGQPGAVDFLLNTPVPENDYWLFRTKVHLGYTRV